jgi:hypothetical protein
MTLPLKVSEVYETLKACGRSFSTREKASWLLSWWLRRARRALCKAFAEAQRFRYSLKTPLWSVDKMISASVGEPYRAVVRFYNDGKLVLSTDRHPIHLVNVWRLEDGKLRLFVNGEWLDAPNDFQDEYQRWLASKVVR